jgi:hypothetical protein
MMSWNGFRRKHSRIILRIGDRQISEANRTKSSANYLPAFRAEISERVEYSLHVIYATLLYSA